MNPDVTTDGMSIEYEPWRDYRRDVNRIWTLTWLQTGCRYNMSPDVDPDVTTERKSTLTWLQTECSRDYRRVVDPDVTTDGMSTLTWLQKVCRPWRDYRLDVDSIDVSVLPKTKNKKDFLFFLFFIFGVLTPLLAIFQLYHGDQFYWWKKPEYPERTTDYEQATGKLDHLRLRVECTIFCNLQSWARTHAILVIGFYELLGNPTT